MTSEERHIGRRKRREEKRKAKRQAFLSKYDSIELVADVNHLIHAARESAKGVRWKASTQKYFQKLLPNIWATRRALHAGNKATKGFIEFDLRERGKIRHIKSVHFYERVIQRSLCDYVLVPVLSHSLVYDNGASLKGKGIHFAMNRCKKHLQQYYRKYGTNEGWVLQIDFSKFFDNVNHEKVYEILNKTFSDPKLMRLIHQFIDSFGDIGLGIGSQVSQILAVTYPNSLDHYVKEVLRLNLSARYMDDSYYFHQSREYLQNCLTVIRKICKELGIIINEKKTRIIPLRKFTFLKVRYELTKTGKVLMRLCRESLRREKHKLRFFNRILKLHEITWREVRGSYESWRGYNAKFDSKIAVYKMDQYYYKTFGLVPAAYKKR